MKGVIKEISEKSGETVEKVNFKGDWVSSKKYWKNDAVNYQGSFWIAANDSIPIGSTPSVADWYEYGKKGNDGSIGPDGNGIANVQSQYYLSTSTGIMTGGQILNDYPAWQNGKYLWTRQLITQTKSPDIIYSDWICQAGQKGADGELLSDDGEYFLCTIGNGQYVGGSFNCSPRAMLNDGMLEVCLVKCISRFKFITMIGKYTNGTHLDDKNCKKIMVYRRVNNVKVIAPKGLTYTLDGEIMNTTELNISVIPNAIKLIVPGKPLYEEK